MLMALCGYVIFSSSIKLPFCGIRDGDWIDPNLFSFKKLNNLYKKLGRQLK